MAKVIITADEHLGVSGKLQHSMWALRTIREYAHRHGIATCFGLGDLYDDREATSIDVLCASHDYHREAKEKYGQHWVRFPGNHDMFLKHSWSVNALRPLAELATIVDTVKIVVVGGVRFWIVPFIHFEAAYMRVMAKVEAACEPGDVLLTHIGVRNAIKNTCFLLKDWSVVDFAGTKFSKIFTGHFHTYQQVGENLWYPGGPIAFKADEGDCDHGFIVFDLESREHEFVNIGVGKEYFPDEEAPPNFLTIPEGCLSDLAEGVVRGQIVRVAIDREYTQQQKLEVQEALLAKGAVMVRWLATAEEPERLVLAAGEEEKVDLFESWLSADTEGTKGLNAEVLRKFNADVVREGDERYNYSLGD